MLRLLPLALVALAANAIAQPRADADADKILDVHVFYTPAVVSATGGEAEARAAAQDLIDAANQAMRNSQSPVRLDLVAADRVAYRHTTTGAALNALRAGAGAGTGVLAAAKGLFDRSRADVGILIFDNRRADGKASLLMRVDRAPSPFGVFHWSNEAMFVHEFGHVMGVGHDGYSAEATSTPGCPDAPAAARAMPCGVFSYAHGFTGDNYLPYTIVGGYPDGPRKTGKLQVYSNPELRFRGAPLGDPVSGDAVRTFRETSDTIDRVGSSEARWTGAISADWHTAGNWAPAHVPTGLADVVVPAGTPNAPRITRDAAARTLVVMGSATLTVANATLTTRGDVWAAGALTAPTGTLHVMAVADRVPTLILLPGYTLGTLRVGTPATPVLARLGAGLTAGDVVVAPWSGIDPAGHALGGALRYESAAWTFEVAPAPSRTTYFGKVDGWFSTFHEGNPSFQWLFGGPGELLLGTDTAPAPDRPGYASKVDAWAFSEPVVLRRGVEYAVTFESRMEEGAPVPVSVFASLEQVPSRALHGITARVLPAGDQWTENQFRFVHVHEPSLLNIGLRAFFDNPTKYEVNGEWVRITEAIDLRVRNLTIQEAASLPPLAGTPTTTAPPTTTPTTTAPPPATPTPPTLHVPDTPPRTAPPRATPPTLHVPEPPPRTTPPRATPPSLHVPDAPPRSASPSAFPIAGDFEFERERRYLSPTGAHFLLWQPDGNLVVYATAGDRYVWGLNETPADFGRSGRVVMQADGNLGVYTASGEYLWSALDRAQPAGTTLGLGADGVLRIVTPAGQTVWSSR